MEELSMFHQGSRALQDEFATRKLADRIVERLAHNVFSAEDGAFISSLPFFFLATADAEGRPDCSYKGGAPGFVRVLDTRTLAFPSYDGNGMFKSLGNIVVNPYVGLLFIDFATPKRLRVNGRASIDRNDALLAEYAGAQLIVRVSAGAIFPNCPRYIHSTESFAQSEYVPREGHTSPIPKWKTFPEFREVLPPSCDDSQGVES